MRIKCDNCFNYVIEIDEYVISFTDIYICGKCINNSIPVITNTNTNTKFNFKIILKKIFIKLKSYLNLN